MTANISSILVVDDNDMQVSLIQHHLKSLNHQCNVETAVNGIEAWNMLETNPDKYCTVLLDRNMPGLLGIEVLTRMREHPTLKDVPVILQTVLSKPEEIIKGMSAGAYYYLTKPFDKELLLTIVNAAIDKRKQFLLLHNALQKQSKSIKNIKSAVFEFKTVDEADDIAILLANTCESPKNIVNGLSELLINAVEHGNLNITYDEKSTLQQSNSWKKEIDRRSLLPEYRDRVAKVEISRSERSVTFTITDEGNGFEWSRYMDFEAERMMDSHGRGIAVANNMSFSTIEYKGKGNVVVATTHQKNND